MYTLRKITNQGEEINISLGSVYHLITEKWASREFHRQYFELFNKTKKERETNEAEIYAFVISDQVHCLTTDQHNYIMMDSGRTFSNVSFQKD